MNGGGADRKNDLFDSLLYGIYSHANLDHRRRVKSLERPRFFADLAAQFIGTVANFIATVTKMAGRAISRKMVPTVGRQETFGSR